MAKFIKSLFQTTPDRRKSSQYVAENDETSNDFTPPLGGRRKLSISRSGRMKQSNRKRHSISMDLYGENLQYGDKPKSVEYHVNSSNNEVVTASEVAIDKPRRHSVDEKTPEEEIDIAFKIIEKT